MSSANDLIIEQLREAQATEQASLSLLESHLRTAPPGRYRTAARRHLDETQRHAHQVGERLTSLGATQGLVGFAITIGEALLGRVSGVVLGSLSLFAGRDTPDVVLRNVRDEIAAEAREVALYETLERLATAAGDRTTASLARAIRGDEERALETLRGLVDGLADRVARERGLGSTERPEKRPEPAPRPVKPTNGGPVVTEPRHITTEVEPVETEGAADPGAEVHVGAPWDGYDRMKAGEVVQRLREADPAVKAVVRLYEQQGKSRKSVLAATEP